MSTEGTATQAKPVKLVHRRNQVHAVTYDGTDGSRAAVAEWVVANHGEAENRWDGSLWVLTLRGWLPVKPGEHVVHGITGEFFPLGADIAELVYDPADNGRPHIGRLVEMLEDAANIVDSLDVEVVATDDVYAAAQRLAEFLETALMAAGRARGR
jgi:hypothetical protein